MSSVVTQVRSSLHHFVHSNGMVADAVYSGAFYALKGVRQFKHWWARFKPVTAEDLWPVRGLHTDVNTLVTGVTNVCNAKCSFCAYPKVVANKTLQTGVMPLDIFKRAVDEWVSQGGQNIDLTPVVGDPLIDPGLFQKIEYAKQAKINVYLTTNAILMNRTEAHRKLVDLRVTGVFISTQGGTREAYERVLWSEAV